MPPKKNTEVAVQERAGLPALVATPALDIDAGDLTPPKVYVGQFSAKAVKNQLVKPGTIFTAAGADDPEPNVIYSPGDDQGVLIHVIALRKGKSVTVDGELVTYQFNDPEAPDDAWVTYQYTVCLPEVDAGMPYKWLFTKSSAPSAKQINMVLKRNEAAGPAHIHAFRIGTAHRENTAKGHEWYVTQCRQVEADQSNVELANDLAAMLAAAPQANDIETTATQPSI